MPLSRALAASLLLLLSCGAAVADEATYRNPSPALTRIVEAEATPSVSLSPDRSWMLLQERPNLIDLIDLAQPELRIAGRRINPRTNGASRTRPIHGLLLKSVADLGEKRIGGLPAEARIQHVRWSPDSRHVFFSLTRQDGIESWVAAVDTAQARKLGKLRLNATAGRPCLWTPDSQALICRTVPRERGAEPQRTPTPAGPVIRSNAGESAPARTYQDLLKNPHDEALFEFYLTTQLVRLGLDGKHVALGKAALIWSVDISPDGNYLLVETLHRPFSYLVPASRFPLLVEIWAADGSPVRRIVDLPLRDNIPLGFGSVPTGPRSHEWRDDAPATLVWAEALDGGDARAEASERDRVFLLPAPFDGKPIPLATLGLRYAGIRWGNDNIALVSEFWWKSRRTRTWVVRPGDPSAEAFKLFDRSFEDRYNDPGSPVSTPDAAGRSLLLTNAKGTILWLNGDGASSEGDRPFLDRLELRSGKSERLWRSEAPHYEYVVVPLDDKMRTVLTRRESKEQPPNYFERSIKGDELRQLTRFPHPTPQLAGLQKELIRYERDDGVALTGTLYLPPGYTPEQGPLPTLLWAYPQEFKSADAAGQVDDSPYRFDRLGWWSPLVFLASGYAVLDDPAMPIIGEGEVEPNDSFVEQLVASAEAAIDELVRRGVSERGKIAIGGHSYGAFMTANLLSHSDLFSAGIARSGAYNRTLTPFGFQSEERTFWEASPVYFNMSPFMHAQKMNQPLLLIHGEADNNSGTFPMQSERYYNALKGHGATARLVMLPFESHGYRARESILHMLWEMEQWLDRYTKKVNPQ